MAGATSDRDTQIATLRADTIKLYKVIAKNIVAGAEDVPEIKNVSLNICQAKADLEGLSTILTALEELAKPTPPAEQRGEGATTTIERQWDESPQRSPGTPEHSKYIIHMGPGTLSALMNRGEGGSGPYDEESGDDVAA